MNSLSSSNVNSSYVADKTSQVDARIKQVENEVFTTTLFLLHSRSSSPPSFLFVRSYLILFNFMRSHLCFFFLAFSTDG